jgi:hypothetical protein
MGEFVELLRWTKGKYDIASYKLNEFEGAHFAPLNA